MLVLHPAVEWLHASHMQVAFEAAGPRTQRIISISQLELSNRVLDEVSLESANEKPPGCSFPIVTDLEYDGQLLVRRYWHPLDLTHHGRCNLLGVQQQRSE